MKLSRPVAAALLSCAILLPALPALAQEDDHGDHDDNADIVVTARRRDENLQDVPVSISVVSADTLAREQRSTIGETLARQPGVSATSFGPNASRPVLRGFQGERVRVLSDGIGSFDVSNTSVDHAVVVNPLTADRIEVLRGPSALVFGSAAVGGVVNVIDSRIPRKVPEEAVHIDGTATFGSAANERALGLRGDVRLGEQFVLHLDGSLNQSDDLKTGGALLSPSLRTAAAASPNATTQALAGLRGQLPNSQGRTHEIAGGAAWIGDRANVGISISRFGSLYGVPIRFNLDPNVAVEQVRLDVSQTRGDGRIEVNFDDGLLASVHARGGYADYHHDELDESGAIGTSFFSKGWEMRLDATQREKGVWSGSFGTQILRRSITIVGDEKYLPPSVTSGFSLFAVQNFDFDDFKAELGGRVEHTAQSARADAQLGNPALRRSFTTASASLSGSYKIADGWRLGLIGSYSERAPAAEELFANGPHAGTQAFEIGNPAFAKEKSKSLEASLKGSGDGYHVTASFYHSWFNGFIFESPTSMTKVDLPVFQITQSRARQYGAELEAMVRLARVGSYELDLEGMGDFTHATILGAGPAPRLPALRLLGGLEAKSDRLTLRGEVEWVNGQDRVAAFETTTRGYLMTNANLSWKPWGADKDVTIGIAGNNLFDVVARRHASFLKDYAPLAGRDIRVNLRFGF